MKLVDLQSYLVDEADFDVDEVLEMSPFDLVDEWLIYNGIIGYTSNIIDVVKAAFEDENNKKE